MEIEKKSTSPTHLQCYYNDDPNIIEIGVDEAGRGPLFGRVYTSAVILPSNKKTFGSDSDSNFDYSKMKDSKKFHSKKKNNRSCELYKRKCYSMVCGLYG